ncbi:MAG: hypothetical protein ACYDH4_10770 [Candidatus Cryosericum sp.]
MRTKVVPMRRVYVYLPPEMIAKVDEFARTLSLEGEPVHRSAGVRVLLSQALYAEARGK